LGFRLIYLKRANSAKNLRIVLILILIFSIGYFFAALLHLSLSRKREYLADACCVDITKNPDAMISALQKISGKAEIKFMPQSLTQMCIENKTKFMRFFSTHPPIKKRIDALRKYALAQS
jgi:heat shock protein HtpX